MKKLNLVIGATGHLGNNLVRLLLENGERVRGTVRDVNNKKPFERLDFERTYTDILDRKSLSDAMAGVDTVYFTAAVYKSWAKDIQKEIIDVNIEGTRNMMETAAKQGVKKIIYVSTSLAIDFNKTPLNEKSWNTNYSDPYRHSKTEAEKLALELAKKYNLWIVSILPCVIVGPNYFNELSQVMHVLSMILNNAMPIDPGFNMNCVHVADVAQAMYASSKKGRNGERYLLGQEYSISYSEVFKLAKTFNPSVKIPIKIPYSVLYLMAAAMELISKINKKPPVLLKCQVKSYYNFNLKYDINKAKNELNFNPRPIKEALMDTFEYLMKRQAEKKH